MTFSAMHSSLLLGVVMVCHILFLDALLFANQLLGNSYTKYCPLLCGTISSSPNPIPVIPQPFYTVTPQRV